MKKMILIFSKTLLKKNLSQQDKSLDNLMKYYNILLIQRINHKGKSH